MDPVLNRIVQPAVDASGVDPRATAVQCANLFLALILTLVAVRIATIDVMLRPEIPAKNAMSVVGSLIVWTWMRACIGNGPIMLAGPLGVVHAGFRIMFGVCLCRDLVEMWTLLSSDVGIEAMTVVRSGLQMGIDASAMLAVYLSICRPPPPRRPRGRLAMA